jgi:hypothetical protein
MEIEQITYIRIVENIYVGCALHHCKTCFVISYFTVSAKVALSELGYREMGADRSSVCFTCHESNGDARAIGY